ncbi:hypothetical protein AMTRI_Chr11g151050 [Amborella trichopoda]
MPIVLDRPHFVLDRTPKNPDRPNFVPDCVLSRSKVQDRQHFVPDHMPKVPYHPYFVSDRMLSSSKVPDRPHFVLDRMLSRRYFGLHFTFFMTWRYLLGNLNLG